MPHFYLLRHALTQPSEDEAALWPLSEAGRRQAVALANHSCWSDITVIISSPEQKALDTARPAAERYGLPLIVDPDLRELRRPPAWYSQELYEQIVARVFAAPQQSVEGWEPAGAVGRRIEAAVASALAGHSNSVPAFVSHGLALTLLLARQRGQSQALWDDWRAIPFAAVARIDLDKQTNIPNWSTM
jgi:broad specificity phosphatase PhoE